MTSPSVDSVILAGGVQVPLVALLLALDLEARGVELRVDQDTLIARPRSALSADDVTRIRAHRAALKTILAYEVPRL